MNIVFVCTGNTCRSPMAEGIFRVLLQEKGVADVHCTSCGLAACVGAPPSENAVLATAQYGADISAHRSRPLSRYMFDETDLFICMTSAHAMQLSAYVPQEKIRVLGGGIADPYGGDLEIYRACAAQIYAALKTVIDEGKWA